MPPQEVTILSMLQANNFPIRSIRKVLNKCLIVMLGIIFSSCATVSATLQIEGAEILTGSASWSLGGDAVISVKNIDGLSCEGKMLVPASSANTEGSIECDDKRKGNFIAHSRSSSWAGEGKFNDGSRFTIVIGP